MYWLIHLDVPSPPTSVFPLLSSPTSQPYTSSSSHMAVHQAAQSTYIANTVEAILSTYGYVFHK